MKKNIPSYDSFLTLLEDANTIDELSNWIGTNDIDGICEYRNEQADNIIVLNDKKTVQVIGPDLAASYSGTPQFLLANDGKFLCQQEG